MPKISLNKSIEGLTEVILTVCSTVVDETAQYWQGPTTLTNICNQLVPLYKHWTVLQCCLPSCTVLAVSVGTSFPQPTGYKSRPPAFVNVAVFTKHWLHLG